MVKVSVSDILAVLRRFNVADDDDKIKSIQYTRTIQPYQETTIVSFRFNKRKFLLTFDSKANDNAGEVLELIKKANPNADGALIENPLDTLKTYGLPFKGHDAYLFEQITHRRRLDKELAERYPNVSRSTLQKYIKAGHVTVNGIQQLTSKIEVNDTDDIALSFPEPTDFSDSVLPILYLDDTIIVVDKPAGTLTHSKGAMNDEFTVADFFKRYTTAGLETDRPGVVHRLDRDTSGVIIGARNPEAAVLLQKQFADRNVKKTYVAVVEGVPKVATALIDVPIGRNPASPSEFRVDTKGKAATTLYEVLATDKQSGRSLVMLSPRTGRTHQLRVHMAYINTPIVGDRVYGKKADRLYLHAKSLELTLPDSSRRTFESKVPAEFTNRFDDVTL